MNYENKLHFLLFDKDFLNSEETQCWITNM